MNHKPSKYLVAAIAVGVSFSISPAFGKKAVEYADMQVVQPLPELIVTGQGDSYDKASANGPLIFRAEAKGRCLWAHAYKTGTLRLTDSAERFAHVSDGLTWKYIFDTPTNRDRTWSSSMKPISIEWNPDKRVKDAAIQACNTKRQSLLANGQLPAGNFEAQVVNKVWSQFSFSCADLAGKYGVLSESKYFIRPHPIKATCQSIAPTVPEKPTLSVAAIPLELKHIAVSVDPKNYTGVCPGKVTFNGTINSEGPGGKIQYRFLNDNKAITAWRDLTIPAGKRANKVSVEHTVTAPQAAPPAPANPQFQINNAGPQAQQPLAMVPTTPVKLEVRHGNNTRSATDSYTVNCQAAPKLDIALPQAPVGLPDITSRQGITIGTQSAPWGGVINLTEQDASASTPRGCQYRMKYDIVNIGEANGAGFGSRLSANSQLHIETNIALAKNQTKNVSGIIFLKGGSYLVRADIDHAQQLEESNEGNNSFRVTVNVPESCSGQPAGVPPRPVPSAVPGTAPATVPGAAPTGAVPGTPPRQPSTTAPPRNTVPSRATPTRAQ